MLGAALLLLPSPALAQYALQAKLPATNPLGLAFAGYSVALSADGNTALMGGYYDNSGVGAVWYAFRTAGVWSAPAKYTATTYPFTLASTDYTGNSVSMSADGRTWVVGGPTSITGAFPGAVFVIGLGGNPYAALLGTGAVGNAEIGTSVAISGDGKTIIGGGPYDNSLAGAAWIFTLSGGVWSQQAKLVGGGAVGAALQGESVALSNDGNTAIVGGYGDNSNAGAAWVFTRSGGVWTQQAKLVGGGGTSVALSSDGNTAIVGGGAATAIFTRSGGVWSQQGGGLAHGIAVALSADGNTAAVEGLIYTRSGGVWTQLGAALVGSSNSVALSSDGHTVLEGEDSDNSGIGAMWVYVTAPTITGVTPNAGSLDGGTSVTISGFGFTGATAVSFGGSAATNVVVVNSNTITATTSAHAIGVVDVTVTNPTALITTGTATGVYTYGLNTSTTSVGSSANPSVQGQSVTFTATVSASPVTPTGTVVFKDGATAFGAGTLSSGTATFSTDSLAIGSHSITAVYTGDANSAVSTSSAMTQTVNQGATTATVGGAPNPSLPGQSVTFTATVRATPPASGTPTGTVTFMDSATSLGPGTLSGGVATLSTSSLASGGHTISAVYGGDGNFTGSTSPGVTQIVNSANAPTVTSISPMNGQTTGGTSVAIGGAGFTGATAVQFGGAAASFTFNSDSSLTAMSPAGSAGPFDVTVTTPGGTSATSAADVFTYIAAPTVTAIAPSSGPGSGGRVVTITGTNFSGATAVNFGGGSATFINVTSATRIVAGSPAGSGTVDVTVTTVGGTSATSAADQFTYIPQPAVTAISPNNGSPSGGTAVTITGANFTGVTAVRFGNNTATSVTVNGITKITATSPAGSGTVDVTVTAAGGTSPAGSADQFSYGSVQTWVSGTGDDTSQCTPDAPCRTFAAAIALTLPGGEIDALDPGDFGPLTITKSVSIVGNRDNVSALSPTSGGTSGIVVTAGVNDVVNLRGLIFDGFAGTGASGVAFNSGAQLRIKDCTFSGFAGGGITFAPGTGSAAIAKMVVENSNILDSGSGVVISPSAGIAADVTLTHIRTDGNSGDGVIADGTAGGGAISVAIANASIGLNAGNGVNAVSGSSSVTVDILRSSIATNGLAGILSNQSGGGSSSVTVGSSQIQGNGIGMQSAAGGSLRSYSNNQVTGNQTAGGFTGPVGSQ